MLVVGWLVFVFVVVLDPSSCIVLLHWPPPPPPLFVVVVVVVVVGVVLCRAGSSLIWSLFEFSDLFVVVALELLVPLLLL